MAAPPSNGLLSVQKSSQLQAVLHPLVLLNISDYITRHTLRQQNGPIIGALLGQQNGRQITLEHAFECHVRADFQVVGGYMLDEQWFKIRLEEMTAVHADKSLELVGWYTLLPSGGPTSTILAIHEYVLSNFNESALLLGFHAEEVLDHAVGGKLPLTIYESNYEVEDSRAEQDVEDRKMDDGDNNLKLKFREVSYSVETDETEMIGMNYVAVAGGTAAAVASKDERPSRSIETNEKGKRRLVESDVEEPQLTSVDSDNFILTQEDEEMLASLTAKANAIKMLQSRIQLLIAYLELLPPSFNSSEITEDDTMETDHNAPSHAVLRQIKALMGRLDLVIPSDEVSFEQEVESETNNVKLVELLGAIVRNVNEARDVGKKFNVIESAKLTSRRAHTEQAGGTMNIPGPGDLMI